jgi:F-type H+-transporting ATPase subunit epsilon
VRLTISTPSTLVVQHQNVCSVRARDGSGSFGIQRGHLDLVTVLEESVMSWKGGDGVEHYAAVRGGVLRVIGGSIFVATREAVAADDLEKLENLVLAEFMASARAEAAARRAEAVAEVGALRLIYQYLTAEDPWRRG